MLNPRPHTTCLPLSAGGETQTARAEHQRVRKALLDAEIDLQKAAAASQDMHRQLQVSSQWGMLLHAGQDGSGCRPVVAAGTGAGLHSHVSLPVPPAACRVNNLGLAASSMHLMCWLPQSDLQSSSASARLDPPHVNTTSANALQSAQSSITLSCCSCSPF